MTGKEKVSLIMPSEEADEKGLELAKAQGEALTRTLRHMTGDVADDGREVEIGEYLVAYAVEKAEGMYVPQDDQLEWVDPGNENAHIEIAVRDAADGRLIPGLAVEVTVIAEDGREIGPHTQPLLWHPYLYHYGRNWELPGDGTYKLRVRFPPPRFMRHDKTNGHRFLNECDVTFDNVRIKTGQE